MKSMHSLSLPAVAALVCLVAAGCDTKISQCNRLIDTVNKHSPALSKALENLVPEGGDEELTKVVKTADDEVAALEFKDEKIAGFATDYRAMLTEAERTGKMLVEAAKSSDPAQITAATESVEKLPKMEDDLVTNVNTYCQAQ